MAVPSLRRAVFFERERNDVAEGNSKLRKRAGRPKGQTAEATRERILNATEALFAEGGYNGTSVRDIAALAEVGIAVVTYHFGLKDDLFEAVVARRAVILNSQRAETLTAARTAMINEPIPVHTLVRGYVMPFLDVARGDDPGWRNYAVLMGRLANSPRGTAVIHRHSDSIAEAYISEFLRSAAQADRRDIITGFMIMVSAMLTLCASTGRLMKLSDAFGCSVNDIDAGESLIRFCSAGFERCSDSLAASQVP